MKKYSKSLSLVPLVILPILQTVVSCSNNSSTKEEKPISPTNIHSLSLEFMTKAKSSFEIIKNSLSYKTALKNIFEKFSGKKDGGYGGRGPIDFNFLTLNSPIYEEFYKDLEDVGLYGDFGSNPLEKLRQFPQKEISKFFTKQLYLPNYQDYETFNATKMNKNIDKYILKNQFGYLPSNLSQFLYYLDYKGIEQMFGIKNIKDIKMNFNDVKGSASILLTNNDNKKFLFNYSSNDQTQTKALKKDHDFKQYIYDRSFQIRGPIQVKFTRFQSPAGPITFGLDQISGNGTGYVIDRVVNDNLPQDHYEFLVATNMHVLDYSKGYNKERKWSVNISDFSMGYQSDIKDIDKETYNNNWDGGLLYKGGINAVGRDEITRVNIPGSRISYDKFSKRNVSMIQHLSLVKPNISDVDDAINQEQLKLLYSNTQYDQTNLIDAVWYTPEFSTSSIFSKTNVLYPFLDFDKSKVKDNDVRTAYNKKDGVYLGNTSSAGADFVISKIVLSKEEIKKILPTLYPLLGTSEESNWYLGMGRNNQEVEVSPNSTLFSGGFPDGIYRDRKWNSGRIKAQSRYFTNDINPMLMSTYWTRYDEQKNRKFNSYRCLDEWYKNVYPKMLSLSDEENKKYNPRGMQIQKLIQMPLFTAALDGQEGIYNPSGKLPISQNDILTGGASGSMVINSRFELVGSLFLYTLWEGVEGGKGNNILQLFKQYTEENKNFSVINQIKEKLNKEGLKTIKMNP